MFRPSVGAILLYVASNRNPQRLSLAIAPESIKALEHAPTGLICDKPLTWVVVGERATIKANIRALDMGAVCVIDGDDRPVC